MANRKEKRSGVVCEYDTAPLYNAISDSYFTISLAEALEPVAVSTVTM